MWLDCAQKAGTRRSTQESVKPAAVSFPQQFPQRRRSLRAPDVVDLPRQAERARFQLVDLPAFGMLIFELAETLVQIVQSGLKLPDAGGSIHFPNALCAHRRSPACLTAL